LYDGSKEAVAWLVGGCRCFTPAAFATACHGLDDGSKEAVAWLVGGCPCFAPAAVVTARREGAAFTTVRRGGDDAKEDGSYEAFHRLLQSPRIDGSEEAVACMDRCVVIMALLY
jgi:hypothetical protein